MNQQHRIPLLIAHSVNEVNWELSREDQVCKLPVDHAIKSVSYSIMSFYFFPL